MSGGYTVYGGYRRQRGGKLFGSFRNVMAPVGKQIALGAKQAARGAAQAAKAVVRGAKGVARNKTVQKIAKNVAEKGAEVAASVAIGALQGRD